MYLSIVQSQIDKLDRMSSKGLNCVWWWWIFRDLEITNGGAARVFEGWDGHGFTQLRGYHYSQVLTTIIAGNKYESIGWCTYSMYPLSNHNTDCVHSVKMLAHLGTNL